MEHGYIDHSAAGESGGRGLETVRYYERRGLLPQPQKVAGAYRQYERKHVTRIQFIKRAQELGFPLTDIQSLLKLEDGTDRATIRRIAGARLEQIRTRIADLRRMQKTLTHVLHECEHRRAAPRCPIIEAIGGE